MATERLHKVMARAGVASLRTCEQMIADGRVTVNGRVVTAMGVQIDPRKDRIAVDGKPIASDQRRRHVYLMLYKPAGYLSVFHDDRGRQGLEALVSTAERLFPVGRLDLESEGLILLTNDGEAAQQLSHPRHHQSKTYLVLVDRRPGTDALAQLRRGVQLSEGKTAASRWQVLESAPAVPAGEEVEGGAWLRVTLYEGRKRQIRRMAASVNLKVHRLIRIGIGPLYLDRRLVPGDSRPLTRMELQRLRQVFKENKARRRGRKRPEGRPRRVGGTRRRTGSRPGRPPSTRKS